jgi:three-Cys-motif partner protein
MPGRNHHERPYDTGTMEKLALYRGYVESWMPVFLHQQHIEAINIFDFFAGPGSDQEGKPGSPIITIEVVAKALSSSKAETTPQIHLFFNEFDSDKYELLKVSLTDVDELNRVQREHTNLDFDAAFRKWCPVMQQRNVANLLFFDQNGVKHITKDIFTTVLLLQRTDLLFFISSSMVNRFKSEGSIIDRVPVCETDLSIMNGSNVHRIVADAYRRLIPKGNSYFLAPFSIKKGSNVYGLIFGSHHPLGIDKFLKLCWKTDGLRGEANFDIDEESIVPNAPSLFPEMDKPKKVKAFERELSDVILKRAVKTNKDIFVFALERGFLGSHAKRAIDHLIATKKLPKQELHVSYEAWNKGEVEAIQYHDGRGTQ